MIRLNRQQVTDWIESPVTEALKKFVEVRIDETYAAKGVQVYCPGDPNKTQEMAAGLAGNLEVWEILQEALEADLAFIDMLEEDDE